MRKYIVFLSIFFTGLHLKAQDQTGKTGSLDQHLISITRPDSSFDYTDVVSSLEKYSLIGLGESSHGTKDIFDAKTEIIKGLVNKGVVKSVFIEADYCYLLPLNDFLQDKLDTNTFEAFKKSKISAIYRTKEVYHLLRVLKDYNMSHQEPEWVSFFGMDMQRPFSISALILKMYPDNQILNNDIRQTLTQLNQAFIKKIKIKISGEDKKRYEDLVAELYKIAGDKNIKELRYCSRLLEQSLSLNNDTEASYKGLRNKFMAENVLWMKENLIKKGNSCVWAHNGHVAYKHVRGDPAMGFYLKQSLKDSYYALSINFNEGYVRAFDMKTEPKKFKPFYYSPASSTSSIEFLLKDCKFPDFYLDLRSIDHSDALYTILNKYKGVRIIGAVDNEADRTTYHRMPFADNFDGIIFFKKAAAAVEF